MEKEFLRAVTVLTQSLSLHVGKHTYGKLQCTLKVFLSQGQQQRLVAQDEA